MFPCTFPARRRTSLGTLLLLCALAGCTTSPKNDTTRSPSSDGDDGNDEKPTRDAGRDASTTKPDASTTKPDASTTKPDASTTGPKRDAATDEPDEPVDTPDAGPGDEPSAEGNRQVLQYHNAASRDGVFVDGAFTRAAASKLTRDKSFSAKISGPTYAQPLYVEGGPGGQDLVVVATEQNQVSAFSAKDGKVVWQKTLDKPAARTNLPCGNVNPLGVTGTPVIDAASRTLYVAAMTLDGAKPKHKLYALSLDDGASKTGWPVDVTGVKAGDVAFDSSVQNQRGALIILKNTLYVPYGGHFGDCGNYHGWVVGVPLDKPSAPFAWATRAKAGGIWAPGGVASDGTSLFVATGNTMGDGAFFSAPAEWGDGEAVIRLPPNLQFSKKDEDYAAAMNWAALDRVDSDVGGSGPVLFDVKGATPSTLALALGKDGSTYLLNSKNLGGIGRFVSTPGRVASEMIITAPAAYSTPKGTFVAFKGAGLNCPGNPTDKKITTLKVEPGAPPKISVAWCNGPRGQGSPIVTTTGDGADSIVWYVTAEGDNKLRGFDGETGEVVFGGGGADEQMESVARFQTPIVAKGRIFVAANNTVYAFKLP